MSTLIVSCSLHPQSKSRSLAKIFQQHLENIGNAVEFLDLQEHDLPVCDGDVAYKHEDVTPLYPKFAQASTIILAVPIYNYSVSSSAKNAIELFGSHFKDKIVGFICSAGSPRGYMSVMPLASSLMLDFRCLVIPKFVFSDARDFDEAGSLRNQEIRDRLAELAATVVKLQKALT